jgi:exoribonuclease R
VVQAIDRQTMITNAGAHFGGDARPHYSLRVDAYAPFSSPMRDLAGCFTTRVGINTSVDDPNLREQIIKAAASTKGAHRCLAGAAFMYLFDAFYFS